MRILKSFIFIFLLLSSQISSIQLKNRLSRDKSHRRLKKSSSDGVSIGTSKSLVQNQDKKTKKSLLSSKISNQSRKIKNSSQRLSAKALRSNLGTLSLSKTYLKNRLSSLFSKKTKSALILTIVALAMDLFNEYVLKRVLKIINTKVDVSINLIGNQL